LSALKARNPNWEGGQQLHHNIIQEIQQGQKETPPNGVPIHTQNIQVTSNRSPRGFNISLLTRIPRTHALAYGTPSGHAHLHNDGLGLKKNLGIGMVLIKVEMSCST
jgi:hypothetical protein